MRSSHPPPSGCAQAIHCLQAPGFDAEAWKRSQLGCGGGRCSPPPRRRQGHVERPGLACFVGHCRGPRPVMPAFAASRSISQSPARAQQRPHAPALGRTPAGAALLRQSTMMHDEREVFCPVWIPPCVRPCSSRRATCLRQPLSRSDGLRRNGIPPPHPHLNPRPLAPPAQDQRSNALQMLAQISYTRSLAPANRPLPPPYPVARHLPPLPATSTPVHPPRARVMVMKSGVTDTLLSYFVERARGCVWKRA